ncbi:MAG: YdcF family protein [Bacteroidota bacterium]
MFFVLSKTVGYLTQPLVVVSFLFLAATFLRNPKFKRKAFQIGLIFFLFISNEFIANEVARWWEPDITPYNQLQKKYKYAIVLTGVTKAQVGPSDRVYFQRGADRIIHTLQLYRLGIVDKILISGGTGRLIDIGWREADDLAKFLKLAEVPDSVILIENKSSNTRESAVEVARMLQGKATADECLLITSGYHLPRSKACFKKTGWDMDIFTTDPLSHDRVFYLDVLIVPKLEAIAIWNALIKEWVGMLAYKAAGYI